jgi:hypothetical protein
MILNQQHLDTAQASHASMKNPTQKPKHLQEKQHSKNTPDLKLMKTTFILMALGYNCVKIADVEVLLLHKPVISLS